MKMLRMGLLLGLMGVFAACGADSEDKGSDAPTYVGVMKSAVVTAAEGGKLEAGAATLNVPAGAVDGDLTVTVAVEAKKGKPDEKNILVDIYDFGPDNTQFNKPVELSFDMAGVKANMDEGTVQVAWLDGDKWQTLPTTVKDGKATAETTHFTPFTIIFVLKDDGTIVQDGGECSGDFDACGGDISGTWNFSGACASFPNPYDTADPENPFAMCKDKPSFAFTLDLSGTVTFGADGSFEVHQTTTSSADAKVPASCLASVGGAMYTPDMVCTDLLKGTLESSGDCSLLAAEPQVEQNDETGTYTTEGSTLTVTTNGDGADAGADEPDMNEYCVQGDTLTVRFTETDAETGTTTEIRYTATRQ
jgi:hypothetical protein